MAQYALPPGAVRRRTAFGLLDADGWTWATIKATFWFMLVIFLLGYVPDRAYYFTVSPTLDLGYNAISPVNLCPADNKDLPCPAPAGAVIPWEPSPADLTLPAARTGAATFTSGENLYVVGGTSAGAASASVLATTITDGNFGAAWSEGPALPEPRAGATALSLSGVPYIVGGTDASGAPSTTVFVGVLEEGALTGWEAAEDLALPVGLSDAVGVSTASGLWIFGGRTADGLSAAVYRSSLSTAANAELQPWTEMTELVLPEARAGGSAVSAGSSIYVLGGEGPSGATNSVFYLALDSHGDAALDEATGRPAGWGVSVNESAGAALPEPRVGQTSFFNGGAVYVIGGRNADGAAVATNYWAVPTAPNGTISGWQQGEETDLPAPLSGAAPAVIGSHVFLVGGTDANGQEANTSLRADLAPRTPFFRLGLFGLTVPALSIKGEIGQQLGYIIAASAAMGNFVLLVIIGWMYSHRPQTYRFLQWVTRGRFRAPPEDEYTY